MDSSEIAAQLIRLGDVILVDSETRETENAMQRSSQFVGDIGEKRTLGSIAGFGFFLGRLQFRRALLDLALEDLAVLADHFLCSFSNGDVPFYSDETYDLSIRVFHG